MLARAAKSAPPSPRHQAAVDWWLNQWGRRSVVTGAAPLECLDLARLIEANGGTADDLDLTGRNLAGVNLAADSAALEGAFDLQGANLRGANLTRANLEDVSLAQARLNRAALSLASLRRANLRGARLSGADLQEADLSGACLRGADLRSADLRGAILQGCDLDGADFRWADLRDADLSAHLTLTTNLAGARWNSDYMARAEAEGRYVEAVILYRQLTVWHLRAQSFDLAAEFHLRERDATRLTGKDFVPSNLKSDLLAAWERLKLRDGYPVQ